MSRCSEDAFVEVSSIPPPRPTLLCFAAAHDTALLRAVFAVLARAVRAGRVEMTTNNVDIPRAFDRHPQKV